MQFRFILQCLLWCLIVTVESLPLHAQQASTVVLVSAASYETVVAPGSIAALFGNGMTAQTQAAAALPLPINLAGVAVKIGGKPAPLFFAAPTQINLQVPSSLAAGSAPIEVFLNNAAAAAFTGTVTIVEAAPGLFTNNATGRGQAVALNRDDSHNAAAETANARPEQAGSVIVLFATGIGATTPAVGDGQAAPGAPVAVGTGVTSVTIGGEDALVLFSGLAPGLVGLWQINVMIPDSLPTNIATSVRVTKGRASLETTVAIAGKKDFGTIAGTVADGLSGAQLANATLTLAQSGTATRIVKTDAQGAFTLPVLRAGAYQLQVSAGGFVNEAQNVTVTAGAITNVSYTLAKQPPNVIVIIADDLGYADLGAQGSTDIVTPNLDSLARNGIRLTNGYVTAPVCAPSRAGFLTGRYQQRFGLELLPEAGDANFGLPTSETTLAHRLRTLGYATSLIGKWHLGTQTQFFPTQRGFDEFFGFLIGMHSYTVWNQPNNPIYRGTQTVNEATYLTDAFTREAVDFIQRKQGQPFYLQLAYNAPHDPMQATSEYLARFPNIADTNRRTFAAMMAAMDDGVGQVLTKLRELKLEENTLIVFFSDNGGPTRVNTSRNTPLNGQKDQLLEGGIRVPFLLQWKGYLPAGAINHAPITTLDLLPSVLSAATGRKFSDATLDGVNLFPHLTGTDAALPHDKLFWRSGATQYAVRAGDWKLLFFQNSTRLYHLANDQSETNNLANANAAKLNELKALYEQWNAQLPAAP